MLKDAFIVSNESDRIYSLFKFIYAVVFVLLIFHILSLFDPNSDLSSNRQMGSLETLVMEMQNLSFERI